MRASVIVFCFVTVLGGSRNLQADDSSVSAASNSFPVSVQVDLTKTKGPVRPIWRFFGADEPNYATMKNGQQAHRRVGRTRAASTFISARTIC